MKQQEYNKNRKEKIMDVIDKQFFEDSQLKKSFILNFEFEFNNKIYANLKTSQSRYIQVELWKIVNNITKLILEKWFNKYFKYNQKIKNLFYINVFGIVTINFNINEVKNDLQIEIEKILASNMKIKMIFINLEEKDIKFMYSIIKNRKIYNSFLFSKNELKIYLDEIEVKKVDQIKNNEVLSIINKYYEKLNIIDKEFYYLYNKDKVAAERWLELFHIENYNKFLLKNNFYFIQITKLYSLISKNLYIEFIKYLKILKRRKKFKEDNIFFEKLSINKSLFIQFWKSLLFYIYLNSNKIYSENMTELRMEFGKFIINNLNLIEEEKVVIEELKLIRLGTDLEILLLSGLDMIFDSKFEYSSVGVFFNIRIKESLIEKCEGLAKNFIINEKCPMIIEPKDWSSKNFGGYLVNGEYMQQNLIKPNLGNKFFINNGEYYDYINFIQKVKFKVNDAVYLFLCENFDKIKEKLGLFFDIVYYENEIKKVNILLEKNREDYKLINKKKDLQRDWSKKLVFDKIYYYASLYINVPCFYYPVLLDFRGRLYYDTTVLNIQQDKMNRGLLCFYEKFEFDLKWFKIAFCRLYGVVLENEKTKENYEKYFNDNFSNKILELDLDFIFKAESPWEVLSYSIEYKKYIEFISNEKNQNVKYMTNLPIFFDATCSVGQLLSLLTGNISYFEALNLTKKGEKGLGDIYIIIIKEFFEFLKNKNNIAEDEKLYLQLQDKLSFLDLVLWRKILKKIIMAVFYGLTSYGIKENLYEKRSELKLTLSNNLVEYLHINLIEFIEQNKFFNIINLINEIIEKNPENVWSFYLGDNGYSFDDINNSKIGMEYYYKKIEKVNLKVDRIVNKKRVTKKVNFNIIKEELDSIGTIRGIKANLTHALDAYWLYLTIKLCYKNDDIKEIIPLFDCVGCSFGDIEKVLMNFKSALGLLFSNKDQFLNILLSIKKVQNGGYITYLEKKQLEKLVENVVKEINVNFLELDYCVFPG